ncbi:MAG: hypothetical protein P1V34_14180 [Alphaproteobacteria bacterium]|nr:hypothetical protein [Alphaproteobacteria bacterium]
MLLIIELPGIEDFKNNDEPDKINIKQNIDFLLTWEMPPILFGPAAGFGLAVNKNTNKKSLIGFSNGWGFLREEK